MRRIVLLSLLLVPAACRRTPSDAEFVPLEVGRQWQYVGSDGHQVTESVRSAVDVKDDDGRVAATAAAVAAADGSEFYYLRSRSGVVKLYQAPTSATEVGRATWVLRFPLRLGATWESWTPAGKVEFRVVDRSNVTAPDGSLTDGVRVDFVSLPEPIFSGHILYARGVGPIEVTEGDYSRKLLGYRAGDGPGLPIADHLAGFEPPSLAAGWRLGKKGWIALGLLLVMTLGLAILPRLRKPPHPARWEAFADPSVVREEGLPAVRAARLEAGVAEHPEWADLRCKLGEVYAEMERVDDSVEQFKKALEINPYYVEAALGLTRVLKGARRFEEARSVLAPVAERHPDYADVVNLMGEVYAEDGRLGEAEVCFRKALAINPRYEQARRNLSQWAVTRA